MLFGIPLQVFSGLASFVMTFMAKRAAQQRETEAYRDKMMLDLIGAQNKHNIELMKAQTEMIKVDKHFAWTKRTLALGVTFGTMVAVLFLPVLFNDATWVHIGEVTKETGGFLFGLIGADKETITEFTSFTGIPLVFGEAFTHMASIVIGHYFGNSLATQKNPYQNR